MYAINTLRYQLLQNTLCKTNFGKIQFKMCSLQVGNISVYDLGDICTFNKSGVEIFCYLGKFLIALWLKKTSCQKNKETLNF